MVSSVQIACLACDLLLVPPLLAEGQRASCPRCRHHLVARPRDGLLRSLAFAVSAAVFLAVALAFPFLSMKAGGLENVMTLPQSALDLYRHGRQTLGVLVLGFIIVLPAVMIGAVLAILVPLVRRQHAAWLVPAGRLVFALAPWSMAEVFVIGVIVSLVKLASMADIVLGISFWSYVAFSICFTAAISSLDRMYVWDAVEQVTSG